MSPVVVVRLTAGLLPMLPIRTLPWFPAAAPSLSMLFPSGIQPSRSTIHKKMTERD